ncbi:uncharacterized protein [Anabrus simplex]|uniref:uncharacterized protein isoform X2 n=1 Tax=Anabrus simplex TaxID=316456 RepID=UPI0035A3BA6C
MAHKKKKHNNLTKKSHKKEKKKYSKKKKKAENNHLRDHHLAMEDMLDLNKKLYPISSYLSDRAEMLNQMFLSLDWKHVKSMLPSSLKNESITRVKELALRELLGMSNERIISVLNGQQLESSSDSDVGNENVTVQSKTGCKTASKYAVINGNNVEEDSNESWLSGKKGRPLTDGLKLLGVQQSDNSSDMDTLEIGITPREIGELLEDVPPVKENKNGLDEKKGKTLLEILELEMRARAIRALLKQHDDETPGNDQTGDVRRDDLSGDNLAVLGSSKQAVSTIGRESQTQENCNSQKSIFQSSFGGKDDSKNAIKFAGIGRGCAQKSLQFESEVTKCIDKCKENGKIIETDSSKEFAQNNLQSQEITSALEQRTETSWAARWLHSKDVQKVVSTSRMCAKIRNRMKLARKLKPSSRNEVLKPEIIGSVKEYKTLEKGFHCGENTS